jgi:hypothetical protein
MYLSYNILLQIRLLEVFEDPPELVGLEILAQEAQPEGHLEVVRAQVQEYLAHPVQVVLEVREEEAGGQGGQ